MQQGVIRKVQLSQASGDEKVWGRLCQLLSGEHSFPPGTLLGPLGASNTLPVTLPSASGLLTVEREHISELLSQILFPAVFFFFLH